MPGMRRLGIAFGALLLCVAANACKSAPNTEGRTAASVSSEEVAPKSSRPSRGEIACHLHSCAPPMYCNRDKGICEKLPCTDSRDCPYGYTCNFSESRCD